MGIILGSAPLVAAQPPEGPDVAGLLVAPTLSLDDLGAGGALVFYGETSSASLSIPVPLGLIPTAINATLDLPFNIRSGTLSINQGDRLVGKLALPLTDLAPLVIPLNGVEVVNEMVSLDLNLNAAAEVGYCLDHLTNPIEFIDGSVTFAGTELAPANVADFLPPILRTVTMGLSSTPTRAESEAAIQLAMALQSRYRSNPPRIVLVPLPEDVATLDGPAQPLERRIVIREGPDVGVSLSIVGGVAQLLVAGPEDQLINQARLLTDPSVAIAASTKVVAGDLSSTLPLPGNSATLQQLGQSTLTSGGIAPTVNITLEQTRFGHPTQGFRVHIMGSYTPVPPEFGARVTISVAGEILDSWPTDRNGAIDRWVNIPDRLVQRSTNLAIGIDTSGITGDCGDFRHITLAVRDSTVVESTPAQPPIPPGFPSLPQALMPSMQVGISDNRFADTVRATQILLGLQRISAVPLSIQLTSLQQAIESADPAILISADGWTDTSIALPVSAEDNQLNLVGFRPGDQETTLTLDPGIRFGSLQTIFDGNRSLLIATSNGAPAQLDELLTRLTTGPGMWSQLRGNAVVGIAGRDPEMVPDRTPASVYGPPPLPEDTARTTDGIPGWWAAVGAVAILGVGFLAYRMGTRRSRSGGGGSPRHGGHGDAGES
ncbi:MAG: hypothetical protein AB7G47_12740 [Mycolicibacterium sp.]|uniref:hypothetical protein n=1 Tax=Mycolicibacterium sp. TaxID=2320850 RepID=UPI003D0F94A4